MHGRRLATLARFHTYPTGRSVDGYLGVAHEEQEDDGEHEYDDPSNEIAVHHALRNSCLRLDYLVTWWIKRSEAVLFRVLVFATLMFDLHTQVKESIEGC